MANGARKKVEFLAMKPIGQVPALEDDDVALFDSYAILIDLDADDAEGYAQSRIGSAGAAGFRSALGNAPTARSPRASPHNKTAGAARASKARPLRAGSRRIGRSRRQRKPM